MDSIAPPAAVGRGLEAIVRRDRLVVASSLALVVVLAWAYLFWAAAGMTAMHEAGPPMTGTHGSPIGRFGITFTMWTIMMIGMMLPSAAASILLFAALVRKHDECGSTMPRAWVYALGYLVVWTAFSAAATLLQLGLERATVLTPTLMLSDERLAAAVLFAAGLYQLLPLKDACLVKCRQPLASFVMRWRSGTAGAFQMGFVHGGYCLGCCWLLMLLLFVAGAMNLLWVVLITGLVLAEKLLPAGKVTSRLAGIVLIMSGPLLLMSG